MPNAAALLAAFTTFVFPDDVSKSKRQMRQNASVRKVPAPGPKGKINFWGVLRGIRVDSPFMQALRKKAPHASVLKLSPNVRRLDRWLCSGNTSDMAVMQSALYFATNILSTIL